MYYTYPTLLLLSLFSNPPFTFFPCDCLHFLFIDCGACRQLIPKSTFRHILGGQKYRKFEDFLGQHFVSHSKFHQRCPGPRCDLIIESDKTTANKQSFTCLCGERVCIRCGGPPHEPCPCDLARKFKEYCKYISPPQFGIHYILYLVYFFIHIAHLSPLPHFYLPSISFYPQCIRIQQQLTSLPLPPSDAPSVMLLL